MKILEVRDGFIKFETDKHLDLSSFIMVSGMEKNYIAQVIQIKRAGENNIAYAKFLFLYDNNELINYDKTLPSIDSEISNFSVKDLCKIFNPENPINAGDFITGDGSITIDTNCFNKNILISVDDKDSSKKIIKNLAKQFPKNLIIDTLGVIDSPKFTAGVDFKLPLNTDALEFMFEDCLNDATSDSKSLIKDIFQDLADYSKTVPFVPFGALKSIVDDMVNKSHVFKLLVLKNKLAKFDRLGYFAATIEEAENLDKILSLDNAVLDLSKLDMTFQNRYLSVIYSALNKQKKKPQAFVILSNNIDKKTLKKIFTHEVSTAFATHSRFKFINDIKHMFDNFIIEPTFTNKEIFKSYSVFLNAMQKETYLLAGKGTNFIPLIAKIKDEPIIVEIEKEELTAQEIINLQDALEAESPTVSAINKKAEDLIERVSEEVKTDTSQVIENIFEEELEEDSQEEIEEEAEGIIQEETSNIESGNSKITSDITESDANIKEIVPSIDDINEIEEEVLESPEEISESDFQEEVAEEFHTEIDSFKTIEINDEIIEMTEDAESFEEITVVKSSDTEESIQEDNTENETLEALPIDKDYEEEYSDELEEITEISEVEDNQDLILVDIDEDEITANEELEKEIVEDVDKVFTTMKEDSISDADLDFIDELNNELNEDTEELTLSEGMEELTDFEEIEEESDTDFVETLEEINESTLSESEEKEILETRNASTPIVPVYSAEIPAEDLVTSDILEQGDSVTHAKYGNGVVEKMIKYGTKTLYSINFDNVGRRLLDPTLTEIKKN